MSQARERSQPNREIDQSRGEISFNASFELLSKVAGKYYLEDRSQLDIAIELGLSRQKIQRLLKQAKDQHIVEINVYSVPVNLAEVEGED